MRKWTRTAACAAAVVTVTALAAGCSSSSSSGSAAAGGLALENTLPTNYGPAEKTTLNVGVVPAMDSAGFFVALHDGLFAREGLKVNYTPEVSSGTAISLQTAANPSLDISGGNYVSYIEAAATGSPIEIVAEGSIMNQGSQTIFTMPSSHITSLSQLKGKEVAVNEPDNIDSLLADSVLEENGLSPKSLQTQMGPLNFPDMGQELEEGQFAAAVLPEPFASEAEQQFGAVPLADLNQGATQNFPIEGYVVTKQWAAKYPNTLKRFLAALEVGQEISDTDRAAVEQAFETLAGPQDGQVKSQIAAVMALNTYPLGIDATRIQRVADVMQQFGVLKSKFNVSSMLLPSSSFNFGQFSDTAS
jgi:NitT/TauT family transport system substrate-binding protein